MSKTIEQIIAKLDAQGYELAPENPDDRDQSRRAKVVDGVHVYLTQEQEAQRDAEEATWDAEQSDRDKKAIKEHASKLISERYPEWKQRNMLAKGLELSDKRHGAALDAEDQSIKNGLNLVWQWIEAVRAHSDVLEAQAVSGTLADDWRDTGWPA